MDHPSENCPRDWSSTQNHQTLSRYHLLIANEVGYLPMEGDAASLFFQLVTCRYEQGSMITTSNLTFSKWGKCFSDTTIAAAIIDRAILHATIINHEGKNYRLASHGHTLPTTTTVK
ncbi:ATP-binding protein [Trueperella pyogenes]|nr:ATP-binding protein [Trueperella pyogenes]UVJ57734.1 ATP-binding protein [Trueperella pyogenes]